MKYKLILLIIILVPLCGKSQKKYNLQGGGAARYDLPKKTTQINEKKYLQESVFNEVTLNITGPRFADNSFYKFPANIATIGSFKKDQDRTKLSISGNILGNNDKVETFFIEINTGLLAEGNCILNPKDIKGNNWSDVSIAYHKILKNDADNIDLIIGGEQDGGSVTITTYSGVGGFITGDFEGNFAAQNQTTGERTNGYKIKCHFKIKRDN
jgi:hypothetical protein